MIQVTRKETALFTDNRADGLVRIYPDGCPHKSGMQTVLVSKYIIPGHNLPFAIVTVKSVRPMKVLEYTDNMAKMDGYIDKREWLLYFEKMYGPINPDQVVHRLQLRIDELRKDGIELNSKEVL